MRASASIAPDGMLGRMMLYGQGASMCVMLPAAAALSARESEYWRIQLFARPTCRYTVYDNLPLHNGAVSGYLSSCVEPTTTAPNWPSWGSEIWAAESGLPCPEPVRGEAVCPEAASSPWAAAPESVDFPALLEPCPAPVSPGLLAGLTCPACAESCACPAASAPEESEVADSFTGGSVTSPFAM